MERVKQESKEGLHKPDKSIFVQSFDICNFHVTWYLTTSHLVRRTRPQFSRWDGENSPFVQYSQKMNFSKKKKRIRYGGAGFRTPDLSHAKRALYH